MLLLQVLMVLIMVGVLLWLVNRYIPMQNGVIRHPDPQYIAPYMEAEWSDLILPAQTQQEKDTGLFPSRHSKFYADVAGEIKQVVDDEKLPIRTICDVGCSTGRLLYELSKRFPQCESYFGVEPSAEFSRLFQLILIDGGPPSSIPFPSTRMRATCVQLTDDFFKSLNISDAQRSKFTIHRGLGESIPRPKGYFDLVCCMNVIDCHPRPARFLSYLQTLLKRDGVLVIACPFDWDKRFTHRVYWMDTLTEYLHEDKWHMLKKLDVEYAFRVTSRKIISYKSQVVLAKRINN